MNIDAILKYKRPPESYYDILGCSQSSSSDQINREYKVRALKLHPDKNPGAEAAEKFQRLQEAKDILTDEKKRKSYDTWLNSGIQIPFEQWERRKGHSMHWAPPRQTKLSIQEKGPLEQGGGDHRSNDSSALESSSASGSMLEKFRRYEI